MLGVVEVEEVSAFCNAKPNRVPVAKNKGNKDKKIGVKSTVIIAFWQEPMNLEDGMNWELVQSFFCQTLSTIGRRGRSMPCPSITPKQFWIRPNCFGPAQNVLDLSNNNFSLLYFTFWAISKTFVPVQNNLDVSKIIRTGPKLFWTYRRTRHSNLCCYIFLDN